MFGEATNSSWFGAFTRLELLVTVLILAILAAILLPAAQWGASGSLDVPVRVMVFDAQQGKPLPFAEVYLFRAGPVVDANSLREHHVDFQASIESLQANGQVVFTDAEGIATFSVSFMTEANHHQPEAYLWSPRPWVYVRAGGFGSSVTPLWYGRQLARPLRQAGEFRVSVGLMPGD